jgi:hypothetical protein
VNLRFTLWHLQKPTECYSDDVNFPNHAQKSTQAVARIIEKSGAPIDYLRLSKLIYLADRQSIIDRGIPIVGGHYFSMRKGPTIGEVMNFVNQRNAPRWKDTISPRFGNEVRLNSKPVYVALSRSELDILDAVVSAHVQRTTDELVEWCHENCPEYELVAGTARKPILVESILKGAKKGARRIQKVLEEAAELEAMDKLLA